MRRPRVIVHNHVARDVAGGPPRGWKFYAIYKLPGSDQWQRVDNIRVVASSWEAARRAARAEARAQKPHAEKIEIYDA